MNIIFLLAPFSVVLGLAAVGAFVWTLRAGQYDDIQGAAARILIDDDEPEAPAPDRREEALVTGSGSGPAGGSPENSDHGDLPEVTRKPVDAAARIDEDQGVRLSSTAA